MIFTNEHWETMEKGVQLYNQQLYWECHEELEHHWLEHRDDPCRNVYWAIIQVAASLYHVQRENLIGARALILKAQEKLQICKKNQFNTSPILEKIGWNQWSKLVFELNGTSELKEFETLSLFRFTN